MLEADTTGIDMTLLPQGGPPPPPPPPLRLAAAAPAAAALVNPGGGLLGLVCMSGKRRGEVDKDDCLWRVANSFLGLSSCDCSLIVVRPVRLPLLPPAAAAAALSQDP